MKITNGVLKVKEILEYMAEEEPLEEKVNQIRIYSGDKYEMVQEAEKGCICAVTGLTRTYPGPGAWDAAKFVGTDTGAGSELPGGAAGRL